MKFHVEAGRTRPAAQKAATLTDPGGINPRLHFATYGAYDYFNARSPPLSRQVQRLAQRQGPKNINHLASVKVRISCPATYRERLFRI
jgi:hypothetical protein